MKEQIKNTLSEMDSDKKDDTKDTAKWMIIVFLPVIVLLILCFRYNTLRIIGLCVSGLLMCYTSYSSYKARSSKLDKEIISQIALLLFTILGIFFKFFGDLVLSYLVILLVCFLPMIIFKMEDDRLKVKVANYVLLGSIFTSIFLNYESVLIFFESLR